MTVLRTLIPTAALLATALSAAPVIAQTPIESGSRITAQAFLSRLWLDDRDRRTGITGYGGRLMFHVGRLTGASGALFARTGVGAFVAATSEQKGIETLHYGAQVDWALLDVPARGMLDPFLSLGLGAFRREFIVVSPGGPTPEVITDLAATPAIGAYVRLTRTLALRADLRDVIVFADETVTHSVEVQGGVSVGF